MTIETLRKTAGAALARRVALYIPSTVDVDTATDSTPEIDGAARFLSGLFGGATATAAAGYWISDAAGLVREGVTIVYAYGSAADVDARLRDIVNYARALRARMRQEAVSLEIGSELFLISD